MLNACTGHTHAHTKCTYKIKKQQSMVQQVQHDRSRKTTQHHLPWLSNLLKKPLWYSIQKSLTCTITTVSGRQGFWMERTSLCMRVSKRWCHSSFPVKLCPYQQFKQSAQTQSLIIIMIASATASDELIQWHFVEKGHFSVAYFYTTPGLKSYALREH